ncbi:hypothetical protein BGX27_006868 [Mortierella sp. AM989]|nr:hypothetical protein BGX27_006868 [Mortierella sp. AM989]
MNYLTLALRQSYIPLLYVTILLILLSAHSNFVHSQAFSPNITHSSTSVFIEGQGLYIQGGYTNSPNPVPQAFMLDLSAPWNISNPVYRKLPDGVPTAKVASSLSVDKQTWFVMADGSAYTYNFKSSTWNKIFSSIALSPTLGLAGATDTDTGLIYIPNGNLIPGTAASVLRVNLVIGNFDSIPMQKGLESLVDYSIAWSSTIRTMLLFGGTLSGTLNNVLYSYKSIWSQVPTKGTNPPGRSDGCFVPAYNDTRMVLFSGVSNLGLPLNDIYFLDVATMTWTRGPDIPRVNTRFKSSCAVSGDFFISWGGSDGTFAVKSNPVLVYNMKTDTWTDTFGLQPTLSPTATATKNSTTPSTPTTGTSPTSAPTDAPTTAPRWPIAVGVTVPIVVLVILVVFIVHRRRKRGSKNGSTGSHLYITGPCDNLNDLDEKHDEEKQDLSRLRGPATEFDPFGFFRRRFSALRGPSTAGSGAKDHRTAFSQDESPRFSHLRSPSTSPPSEPRQQINQSESPRDPNTGETQFECVKNGPQQIQRYSHLRGPSTAGVGTHQDDDDWTGYYDESDCLDEEQNDYIPPPMEALPPRPKKSRYPMPPGLVTRSTDKEELPARPPVARQHTRRAPATYERESMFGYVDPTPMRGSPHKIT